MKQSIARALTFSLSLGLAGTIINPVSVLAENVVIEINEENYIDGYININDYLKLTSGSYEKKVISENEIIYSLTIESSKTENSYIIELASNKNNIKLGDKYIPYGFKEIAGYKVPDNSKKLLEKDGFLYIPISFFEGLFNEEIKIDRENKKIIFPRDLGEYLDENIENLFNNIDNLKKKEEELEKDKEKDSHKKDKNTNSNKGNKKPSKKPSKPNEQEPKPEVPPVIENPENSKNEKPKEENKPNIDTDENNKQEGDKPNIDEDENNNQEEDKPNVDKGENDKQEGDKPNVDEDENDKQEVDKPNIDKGENDKQEENKNNIDIEINNKSES